MFNLLNSELDKDLLDPLKEGLRDEEADRELAAVEVLVFDLDLDTLWEDGVISALSMVYKRD